MTLLFLAEVQQQIPEWSSDLAKQVMQIELLIDNLPDLGVSEEEQLARLTSLEQENVSAGERLLGEVDQTGESQAILCRLALRSL